MPKYDNPPNASDICDLASSLELSWAAQSSLDDAQLSYLLMHNQVDIQQAKQNGNPGFRSGVGYMVVKEDAALLTVTPGAHINVPTEKEKDKEHASLLESWLAGAWKLSQQAGNVWNRLPFDLRGLGRAWSCVYPNPSVWAGAGESDDPEMYRRDNWPIQWRYVSPRSVYTYFPGDCWLPEVVEIRQMKRKEIAQEFGEGALPGKYASKKYGDNSLIPVYEWANHQWCATVIKDGNAPVREYKHGLGQNPYVLIEAELLPENTRGWRWAGALFGVRSMIDTLDEILSQLRENSRENAIGQRFVQINRDSYEDDLKVGGRPKEIKIGAGEPTVMLWHDEIVGQVPFPPLTPEMITLLGETKQLIYQAAIRPVERGEAKSGTSQNQFVTAVQIAEREFDPSMKALTDGAEGVCRRFFACVESLNMDYEDAPDKVAVFAEKGLIEVGPEDVKGWKNAIQMRASRAIPIDRNIILAQANQEKSLGFISPETTLEQTMGFEDPQREIRKARRAIASQAIFEQVMLPQIIAFAQQKSLQPTPQEQMQMEQQLAAASGGLQQFAGAMQPPVPEGLLQAQANISRTGVPQQPQIPTEQVLA